MPRADAPEARPPHPGRTSAQRRALDAIGCGQPPRCSGKTIAALLEAGLIVDAGGEVRRDALGSRLLLSVKVSPAFLAEIGMSGQPS